MYKQTIGDLDSSEAQEAMEQWELSKYTTKELKDELASREEAWDYNPTLVLHYDIPEQHEVCKHNMEMGYCPVEGCTGSY